MKTNLIKDLNTLTTIEVASLERLSDLSVKIICHDIYENFLAVDHISEIDIGIGTLLVSIEDDIVKYKFIPSTALEQMLTKTFDSKTSPLLKAADKALVDKIEQAYKELL